VKAKHKKAIFLFFLAGCLLPGYWLWLALRPVEIIAIHHGSRGFSDILVTSFPPTDKGKINWWLKNKNMLKNKYGIPKPGSGGSFYLTFWLFGEGYKEEGKYDRLCFKDMQSPVNCIEKNRVFSVEAGRSDNVFFTVDNAIYRMKENGQIVKDVSN